MARISVNQTGSVESRLDALSQETADQIRDVIDLYQARATIRRLIGEANAATDVHRLLVERDELNTTEKFLVDLLEQLTDKGAAGRRRALYGLDNARVEHTPADVERALANVIQRMQTVTAGEVPDYIMVPALDAEQVASMRDRIAMIRRRRTTLNDELAGANLKAHITLPDEVVTVLRQHKIVE